MTIVTTVEIKIIYMVFLISVLVLAEMHPVLTGVADKA
jgi:hypothetical protein